MFATFNENQDRKIVGGKKHDEENAEGNILGNFG
jgi:hypothetical protein